MTEPLPTAPDPALYKGHPTDAEGLTDAERAAKNAAYRLEYAEAFIANHGLAEQYDAYIENLGCERGWAQRELDRIARSVAMLPKWLIPRSSK